MRDGLMVGGLGRSVMSVAGMRLVMGGRRVVALVGSVSRCLVVMSRMLVDVGDRSSVVVVGDFSGGVVRAVRRVVIMRGVIIVGGFSRRVILRGGMIVVTVFAVMVRRSLDRMGVIRYRVGRVMMAGVMRFMRVMRRMRVVRVVSLVFVAHVTPVPQPLCTVSDRETGIT
tara:strand:- start:3323 stop:3832 length:510 start_codon:yes stop_codon:yes gene_type:complete